MLTLTFHFIYVCLPFPTFQCGVPAYCKLGPMEQLNEQTGLIDGSAWYGPDKAATDKFRYSLKINSILGGGYTSTK